MTRPLAASGQSPREAFNRGMDIGGLRLHRIIPYDEVCPPEVRPTKIHPVDVDSAAIRAGEVWCDDRTRFAPVVPFCSVNFLENGNLFGVGHIESVNIKTLVLHYTARSTPSSSTASLRPL